ncbi:hypothetical protein RQP46_001015 [Phenoliferia psychrophenolica]
MPSRSMSPDSASGKGTAPTGVSKGQQQLLEDSDLGGAVASGVGKVGGIKGLLLDKKILGIASMASFGGFLFGFDQGVVGNVLVIESFGAHFPAVYMDSSRKGWFVSTLLLAAWAGSLINGPFCDKFGRKNCIMFQLILFMLGGALQAGAPSEAYLFGGRAVAGLSVGALTHVVPMYIAELSPVHLRGSLVALQQLSITLGILFSYWIAYGKRTFDAYRDVPIGGCTGQSDASFRIPLAFQLLPALMLEVAMFFMPRSPRWLVEVGRDSEAKATLASIRSSTVTSPEVRAEFLDIKTEVLVEREIRSMQGADRGGVAGYLKPYADLFSSRANFHRLAIGCLTMFYQQFIGCNAIIYYAPTTFVYIYDVNFSYSWAPIGWVLPSEIFNLSTRSTGTSITTSATWMCNFVIGLVSPIMLEKLNYGGTYFFFAAFAILGFLTVYFFLPETRMKTLEEMDELFGAKVSSHERDNMSRIRRELAASLSEEVEPSLEA